MSLPTVLNPLLATFAPVSTRVLLMAAMATLCLGVATVVLARENHQISQKGRAFNLKEITVEAGDTIQFLNDDPYIHQIFIHSPTFNFDSAEAEPGRRIDVQFPSRGIYEVRCHIHPKMLLAVTVK